MNAYEILFDRAAARNWDTDDMLQIACDFIDDGCSAGLHMEVFEEYLDRVEEEEKEMGLQREPDPAPVIGFPESDIDWYDYFDPEDWIPMAPSQEAEKIDRRICETTTHCGKPMFYQPWIKQGPDRLHYRAFAVCLWCGEVQEF